jgi:hypothetical protein
MKSKSFALLLLLTSFGWAQSTNLTCVKSGTDLILSWSGGPSLYSGYKAHTPTFSASLATLFTDSAINSHTLPGAVADGIPLTFYVISDATKPAISITSPSPDFVTTEYKILVTGTVSGAADVYVSGVMATINGSDYTTNPSGTPNVPLVLGSNTLYAVAFDSDGDIDVSSVSGSRGQGNQPPTIDITSPTASTIYSPVPTLTVTYSDPDANLDLSAFRVISDGADITSRATPGASSWTYTLSPSEALTDGYHVLTSAISDTMKAPNNAAKPYILSPPILTAISPDHAKPGDTIILAGNGFSTTLSENLVYFDTVTQNPTSATETSLTVTVPSAAPSCFVNVEVNYRPSNSLPFTLDIDIVLLDTSSVTYEDANSSLWVADRDYPSNADRIWEFVPPAPSWQKTQRPSSNIPYVSKNFDSAGNIYYCNGLNSSFNQGQIAYIKPDNTMANFRAAGASSTDPVYCRGLAVPSNATEPVFFLDGNLGNVRKVPLTAAIDKNYGNSTFTFNNPAGAILMDNTDLVISGTNAIYKIASDETVTTLDTGYSGAAGIDWDGIYLLVADMSANKIIMFDPTDTANKKWTLAESLNSPRAVAFGLNEQIFALEQTRFLQLPSPSLTLKGANMYTEIPTKIYADVNPETGQDQEDLQYVTLTVQITPLSLFPNASNLGLVTWTYNDPDDPSDDAVIDPDGPSGNDNLGTFDDYPNVWEQVGSYTLNGSGYSCTTRIVDGLSQVKFHPSDAPGDNFIVRVAITIPRFGTISVDSPILTVWKKLFVEVDAMGPVIGPFEDDDTAQWEASVPMPDISLFTNAFQAAYVDIADAGGSQSTVDFHYRVDMCSDNALLTQINLAITSASSTGHWLAYLQGAYSIAECKSGSGSNIICMMDNDPDGEIGGPPCTSTAYPLGVVNRCWGPDVVGALIFNEIIRDLAAQNGFDEERALQTSALHESGHQFNLEHRFTTDGSGGIMEIQAPQVNPQFNNDDIRKIRTSGFPRCTP